MVDAIVRTGTSGTKSNGRKQESGISSRTFRSARFKALVECLKQQSQRDSQLLDSTPAQWALSSSDEPQQQQQSFAVRQSQERVNEPPQLQGENACVGTANERHINTIVMVRSTCISEV